MTKKKIITQEQIDEELKRIEDEANEKKKAVISEANEHRNKKIDFIKNMIQEIFLPKVEKLQSNLFKLNRRNLQKTLESINLTFADTEQKEENETQELENENKELTTQLNDANLTIATLQSTIKTLEQEKTDLLNRISDEKAETEDKEKNNEIDEDTKRHALIGKLLEELTCDNKPITEEYLPAFKDWAKSQKNYNYKILKKL